ncbi:hypothetical protein J4E86_010850 [Alternaria arbusti]|uniref:uncharacterized protein n=1 Tax=Alternaria arbusti TaxID=232088 RepID=UPI002220BDC4|nr:uncharacterized protein J4E86_010850 [Alternaria arbusti]KAI4940470.1 hypothetical protein J4E86_010850 [Alternaria arbusti]
MAVLVKKHGIAAAWRALGGSRAFRDFIKYAVLANPTLYAYLKTPAGRKILKEYLADFLFVRSKKLNGFVRSHVPDFIRDVVLAMSQWTANDVEETALRKALCEQFVRRHPDAFRYVTTRVSRLVGHYARSFSVTETANLVAAAAATGNLSALKHFARTEQRLLWSQSPAFGYPLDIAVYAGQDAVVKAIVQQAITNQSRKFAGRSYTEHYSFCEAIRTAIELKDIRMVKYLLSKYISAFGLAEEFCMKAWLKTTIEFGDEDVLKLILTVPSGYGPSIIYAAFETACRLAKPDLLHLLFGSEVSQTTLSINHVQGFTYPLLTAVEACATLEDAIFIKELLKLGADPNGPAYLADLDRPLVAAMRDSKTAACLILLEAGANPHLVACTRWVKRMRKLYPRDTEAGKALRKALKTCEKPKVARDEDFLVEVVEADEDVEMDGDDEMELLNT